MEVTFFLIKTMTLSSSFLRSVAYRQFTYLIHGHLGGKRISLPACALHAIRNAFRDPNKKYTGFEDNE